ncbi:MAG: thioether cross-link-forming SCIFF peptide maturase, partial [Oscillospiraceae bacterium]
MIHRYQQGQFHIVLDINSGAIHLMDLLGYELTGLLTPPLADACPSAARAALADRYTDAQIDETYAELLLLTRSGQLFSEDDYARLENRLT